MPVLAAAIALVVGFSSVFAYLGLVKLAARLLKR